MRRLILVRHGQTEWNREERFRGQVDLPLNETGLRQAEQVARALKRDYAVSAVFASPLSRAMRTAEAIGTAVGVDIQGVSLLTEFNYGEWEGKTPEEVEAIHPETYHLWLTNPGEAKIPGGESVMDLRSRLRRALDEIMVHPLEGDVALVTHRMITRMLTCILLEADTAMIPRLEFDTGSISVFEWTAGGWVVRLLNDTCHLESKQHP